MQALDSKLTELKQFIAEKGKNGVVIAFSGGVDSSTLAAIAHQVLGDKAVAIIAQSPTYTQAELKEAQQVAKEIGIKHYITLTDVHENPEFIRNPENRCYFCKKELLEQLKVFAHQHGFAVVFEGTNFSDLDMHRPGYRAVQETRDVYSPWVEAKFSKDEIRQIARNLGLSVHDKPAVACLASRIPFNEPITPERLERVEKAENAIREIINVKQLRVRDHNGIARIEVGPDERQLIFSVDALDLIAVRLKRLGFKYVTFDLDGYRSGSMLDATKP